MTPRGPRCEKCCFRHEQRNLHYSAACFGRGHEKRVTITMGIGKTTSLLGIIGSYCDVYHGYKSNKSTIEYNIYIRGKIKWLTYFAKVK